MFANLEKDPRVPPTTRERLVDTLRNALGPVLDYDFSYRFMCFQLPPQKRMNATRKWGLCLPGGKQVSSAVILEPVFSQRTFNHDCLEICDVSSPM